MTRAMRQPLTFTESDGLAATRSSRPRSEAPAGGVTIDVSNPEHVEYLRTGGVSGSSPSESLAMKVAAVYRGVHLLAGVPGNMPLNLREQVGERETREATGHPNYGLLTTRPNSWQTPQDFKRMLTAHVVLRGNGYAIKVPGVRGIQALWPIHPDRMRPVMDWSTMDLKYEYASERGVRRQLPASDVFHVRGLTLDGITGIGVLAYARELLGMATAAQRAAAKMWRQGAMVGGALEHPGELSEEAYDRLKDSLAEQHSGADNAGKWIILEEGMKASNVFLSAADMQFLESRQLDQRQLLMMLGVPPHMAGDTEKSTSWGTGLEQQTAGFVAFNAEDYLTAWEQTARRDLLTPEEARRMFYRFVRAALVRGDIRTRYGAYGQAIQHRIMTPNEVRALEDMNPREGGDDFADQPTAKGPTPEAKPQEPDDDDENAPRDR